MAPVGITFGRVVLRGWQINALAPLSSEFDGYSAYLVRVHYDLAFEQGTEPPSSVEVGFRFPSEDHVVVDALPRRVPTAVGDAGYELNAQLNFVRRTTENSGRWPLSSPASSIELPPMTPSVDCMSGPGASQVSWRHSRAVAPGTHTAYFVLRVPSGEHHVQVVAHARYAVDVRPGLALRPAAPSDAFTVTLPVLAPSAKVPSALATVNTDDHPGPGGPRVFVSYAWETVAHRNDIDGLCELLTAADVDVRIDRASGVGRRNWELWTNTELLKAAFILVIASPAYRAVGNGEVSSDKNRGLQSEFARIADLLHGNRLEYTKRILPIVLPGRSNAELPLTFLPFIGDYYEVDALTPAGVSGITKTILDTFPDTP